MELLIVMVIITLLLSLAVPLFTRVKERARRMLCQNNIRLFITAIHSYADDNRHFLPSGLSDMGEDEHTPVLSQTIRNSLVHRIGNERVFFCPWVGGPFSGSEGWVYGGYGYVIGYNYLGGHRGTPWPLAGPAEAVWESPQVSTRKSHVLILTELNAWTAGEKRTFAPHGKTGPITRYADFGKGGMTAKEAGAAGGNVGYLDGSFEWRDIRHMKIYRGSRQHEDVGCYAYW